ncbi:phosphotransferase enzyme family protein [Paenibacillus sp. CF384]|uniref:phosphotransferase enzyme family protein n=1 Tax=Paenibacillus sp. CF384 TaxID=1884382 RepID=UPI000897F0BD|nr:phosphotransferase [Paenibacillus sp. CF384]SDW18014.1 Ser/Thr protein kinase RdoA involved in Cpx stress response, MazF antagonist [Paenibacillus sp. CF384]
MLKLKYLFHNENLTEMILRNWDYDAESTEMFQKYRISSNAIYPFLKEGKTQLLRFAPIEEKSRTNIEAELAFIKYLQEHEYGVLVAVKSNAGEELAEIQTPWGGYYASVFERVPGSAMNQTDLTDEIVFSHGQALGELHRLSSEYEPGDQRRWSHREVLDWIDDQIKELPNEEAARSEVQLLRDYFAVLPIHSQNYGLIHYDYEYDNVFYDYETKRCYAIDFDDAMYHWYAMDIEQALDSLQDCISEELYDHKKQRFLEGYSTAYALPENMESVLPALRRFANIYGYARLIRCVAETWDHEPEWMQHLRTRFEHALSRKSTVFGTKLE